MTSTTPSTTIAQTSMRTFVARLIVTVLSVVTGIVAAKWLGPIGKGAYSGTIMLVSIVMVAPAGISTAITYALTKQRRDLSELLPSAGVLLVLISALAWIGALAWGLLRGWNPVLSIFVAAVPPSIVLSWQGGLYVGLGRLRNLNAQLVALALATLCAVLAVVSVFHGSAIGALWAWVVCLYGAAFVVIWHVFALSRRRSRALPVGQITSGLVRFGTQSSVNLFLGAVNYRIDSIILIALMGTATFGIYSIAVGFGEQLFSLTRPITAAISRDIGINDATASAAITAKVIRTCTALVAAVSVVAFVFGPWLIDAVYGTRFRDATIPLRILIPGIVAFSTAGTFAAFFILQVGRPLIISAVNLAMIVVQALMCFALVPRFGMSGAAFASTITYVCGALMNTAWFCRMTRTSFWDVWIVRPNDIEAVRRGMLESVDFAARRLRPRTAQGATRSDAR